jgi:hypothetical protein
MEDEYKTKKSKRFVPTPLMLAYAQELADQGDEVPKKKLAKEVDVNPSTISNWKHIPGFNEWLEEAVLLRRKPIHKLLLTIAIEKLEQIEFWKEIAKKYGFIDQEIKSLDKIKRLVIDLSGDEAEE